MKAALTVYFLSISLLASAQSFQRCDFDRYLNKLKSSSEFRQNTANFEQRLAKAGKRKSETVFLIPVVIHVIYKNSQENITDAQIQTQLDILNTDFRKLNADTTLVESGFSIADSRIEFCLAKRDPQGNVTTGINRVSTTIDNIGTSEQYYIIQPAWDKNNYMNIWVGDYGTDGLGNDILGRSSTPYEPNANKDGIIITYKAFGTIGTVVSPYNKGRTTTHEVGHWLGLYHPWGVSNVSCNDDDQVADTPNQDTVYFDCPSRPQFSCGSKDMISNFMGYVDDNCMGNYTEGQKTRMRNTIVLQRSSLLLSKGCLPVGLNEKDREIINLNIFPNPAKDLIHIQIEDNLNEEVYIELIDLQGKSVQKGNYLNTRGTSITINITGISEGIYILNLESGKSFHRTKIVVQH